MAKTPLWLMNLDVISRGNRIREHWNIQSPLLSKAIRLVFYIWDIVVGFPVMIYLIAKIGRKSNNSVNVAVVAIAKNESEYIREWVAYHKAVGVERIFIYDNDSTDNMKSCIQDFIDSGFVEYQPIHGQCRQMDAYNHALQHHGRKCKYMAFIDCDEFLTPLEENRTLVEILDDFFSLYPKAGALAVNWCMFGSSRLEDKPEGMLIENFLWRADIGKQGTNVVKSIIRPTMTLYFDNPHYAVYSFGYKAYDIYGHCVEAWNNDISDYSDIKINHYFTKSKMQWIKRRSMGKADLGSKDQRTLQAFYNHANNDVIDKSSIKSLERTKGLLNECL